MAARQLHRLNALKISKEVVPGYYADGGGLYLQISSSGSRSWIFRYMIGGRRREMGLGPLSMMSLAAARREAADCRDLVKQKTDPIEARKRRDRARAVESAPGVTFRQAAEAFIADRDSTWKSRKHAQQWRNTMETYLSAAIIEWARQYGIRLDYIQPGKPQQNAYVERFNRTVRYEWLSQYHREDLDHVQRFATDWMWTDNHDRPNMALGGFTSKQRLAMAA